MSAILKFDFQRREQWRFSEANYLNYTRDPSLHVGTTFFLKEGETTTSHEPIPHPLNFNPYIYHFLSLTVTEVDKNLFIYAAVNGHLELTLLKDRQRFDAISTSNLEVYTFRDWWILTYFIFGHDGSSPNNIWSMVNLERTCVLLFYYFLCLKVNLDLEKSKSAFCESSPNFIFAVVNLDPIVLEKRWIDGESWPNDFVEKVNWGEDLRWVGSRCPLTRALTSKTIHKVLHFLCNN